MLLLGTILVVLLQNFQNVGSDGSDVGLNTVEMIENHGYPCETHNFTTEDGFVLGYHRIPYGKNSKTFRPKPAVLLMHGTFSSSADYVNMGPDRILAYILAEIGYDVWIGNARGNEWSRNHTSLDPIQNPAKYFNFSWHEMGFYDLPVAIDYILDKTGNDALYYVGHSQGTTAFMVLAICHTEYNHKIKLASLMAPPSEMTHQQNPIVLEVAKYIYELERIFYKYELYELGNVKEIRKFLSEFCSQEQFYGICTGILFELIGADAPQMDISMMPLIFSNTPTISAWKQWFHYLQQIKNGGFSWYDYGENNLEMYGSETAPVYNVSKISAPVAVYYGKNDRLVNFTDVQTFIKKLPNVANDYFVPDDLFNHFDFLYAKDVFDLVYANLIKTLQQY